MACNNESNFNFIKFLGKQNLCLNNEQAELLASIVTACNNFESFTFEEGIIKICLMVDGELVCKEIDLNTGGIDTDEKVKVSLNDTTAGYLNGKLIAGNGIVFTENNDGSNETMTIEVADTDNELVYGGVVTWLQNYDFEVTEAGYYINGQFYTSPYTVVTLDPADPTFDRIDVIYVDNTGTVGVITGTPSLVPSQPGLDLGTQLGLGFVLVEAGSTQPGTGFNLECGYLENGEWTAVAGSGTGINVASNNSPYAGFTVIEATSVVDGETLTLTRSSSFAVQQDFNVLTFKLKSKGLWTSTEKLILSFRLAGVQVGNTIELSDGDFSFDSSNTTDYQTISIPLQSFGFPLSATVDEFHIEVEAVNAFGWFLDNLCLQGGLFNQFPEDDDIHNQDFGAQTPGRFWIKGNGKAEGWFTSPESGFTNSEKYGWGSIATGVEAHAFGFDARATTNEAMAFGSQSRSTGGTAIGYTAVAGNGSNTAVGKGAIANIGGGNTAIGAVAIANSNNGVAIGENAQTTGPNDVSIGYYARSSGQYVTNINTLSTITNNYSAGIGAYAIPTADRQFVIGGGDGFGDFGFHSLYFGSGVTNTFINDRFWGTTGASGNNVAGTKWTFGVSPATGNAAGGYYEWQTSDVGASGTTLQTLTTKMALNSNTKGLYLDNIRFQVDEGTNVVAANDLTLGTGNTFTVTGNTQINAITNTNWQDGAVIHLHLTGIPTLKHNTAGGAGTTPLRLAGAVDFVVNSYTVLELELKDGFWNEVGRSTAASAPFSGITANNGLTANTSSNVQLGGTLIQHTTIDMSNFEFSMTKLGNRQFIVSPSTTSGVYGLGDIDQADDKMYLLLEASFPNTFGHAKLAAPGTVSIGDVDNYNGGANFAIVGDLGGQPRIVAAHAGNEYLHFSFSLDKYMFGDVSSSLNNTLLTLDDANSSAYLNAEAVVSLYSDGGSQYASFVVDNTALQNKYMLQAQSASMYSFIAHEELGATSRLEIGSDTRIELDGDIATLVNGRFSMDEGATLPASNNLTLGYGGNSFLVSGNTQINAITTTDWEAGTFLLLRFSGTPTLKHNTAGGAGTATMLLAGSTDYVAAPNDCILFEYDGGNWHEVGRKLAAVAPFTGISADNGLTENVANNVRLGGTLVQNTDITHANFTLSLNADAAQTNNILQSKNQSANVRARITKDAAFSNTGGQSSSEIFGDGASVTGLNSVVFGSSAAGTTEDTVIGTNASTASSGGLSIAIGRSAVISASNPGTVLIGNGGTSSGTGGSNVLIGVGVSSTVGQVVGVGYSASILGANSIGIGANVSIPSGHTYSQAYGFGATTTAANQLVFGASNNTYGGINDIYLGRGVTCTVANNIKMQPTGASGTNMAGNLFTIAGSPGTGTGAQGSIMFQTSVLEASGSTLQSLTDRAIIHGTGVVGIGKFSSFNATRLEVVDDSIAGASIVKISSTSTAAATDSQKGLDVSLSGANSNSGQDTYAIDGSNTHTGSTSTNIGVRGVASGGTTNYGVVGSSTGTGASAGVYGFNLSTGYGVWASSTGNGTALRAEADTGYGVNASSNSSTAVQGISTSGSGVHGGSTSGVGVVALVNNSTTNNVKEVLTVGSSTTGTAASGLGGKIAFRIDDDTDDLQISNEIISNWTDAGAATKDSLLSITGVSNDVVQTLITVTGAGIFTLTQGLTDYTDDAAASAGGIPVNGLYRTGSAVKIRVS